MKNYVQPGDVVTCTAPYAVASGGGFLVGAMFAVAANAAANGATVEGKTNGVFDLPKTSAQAWTFGVRVYWDDANKVATTTSAGNTLIGVAVAVAANPSATGRVRLNGAF